MEHFLPLAVASGPTTSTSENDSLSPLPTDSFEQSEDQIDKVSTEESDADALLEQQLPPTSNLPISEESAEIKPFAYLRNIIEIGMSWSYRTIV